MAFSKYSFGVIEFPIVSSSRNEKSLTTHRKAGKYLATSSGSDSPITSDLICSSFDKSIYNRLMIGVYD
jgi:hypothetical protein